MGRVLTNNVSLAYTIETALEVAGTEWFLTEPNSIDTYGAEITTVARSPISKNRQRRKGTVTDLDSPVEFGEDITMSSFRNFIEGYCFVTGVNTDVTEMTTTAAETTGDTFTVSALTAAQADKFEIDTLIYTRNFSDSGNNGLFSVDADIAASATAISVAENLTDEASAPSSARVSFAGHRIAAGDTATWTWTGASNTAVLALTALGTELTALGLNLGQRVHIGSPDGSGGVTNAFENSAANDMFGYASVKDISADAITFNKVDTELQFTDGTAPVTAVDVLFGEFIRNVPTDHADYIERTFQFEAEFPNLDVGGASEFQYAKGNYCNSASFELPLANKATVKYGFTGTDTDDPVAAGSRKSGASSALDPIMTSAFNSTSDIAVLRITDVDETGLTTDFKSLTLTLNNNASPEKVLGKLGAKYINVGNFEVDIEAKLIFTEPKVVNRIRANTTLTMDFTLFNDDGAIHVDIPSMTLGGGSRDFPVNESVLINTTAQAFQDASLGHSIGVSIFPVTP